MRKIPDKIKSLIINVLNCNITDAIYIFGSYGTNYYEYGASDIDIAWFTNKKLDLIMKNKFEDLLSQLLGIEVDLVVVGKDTTEYLLYNIFQEGECIFVGTKDFESWFDYFYDKTKLDREFLDLYMEEKIKYV